MIIEIDLNKIKRSNLSVNQYTILYLLYYKEWEIIKDLYLLPEAIEIRNSLIGSKYILDSSKENKFFETTISVASISKLLGIRSDKINFIEFYLCYPIRFQDRVFRAASIDTIQGQKHEKKYLSKIKTVADHTAAVKAITAFVEKQRIAGKLAFLPAMETVLNNALWEGWQAFVQEHGTEGANWHEDSI